MPKIDVAVGVVRDNTGRVLIAKRKDTTHQGGLWEFPGGKIEALENAEQALNRELFEELGIKFKNSSPLIKIYHSYADLDVQLHVRDVYKFEGKPVGRENQPVKWVAISELKNYAFPAANKSILKAIQLPRQYAILSGNTLDQLLRDLNHLARQNVTLVQIRLQDFAGQDVEKIVTTLSAECRKFNMAYLLNSRIPVKKIPDAGVHLTAFDLMRINSRPEGAGFTSASCHNLCELRKAELLALDFVVLSPVMKTSSHPEAKSLGWARFEAWVSKVNIPVYALGGMTKQDMERAISYGAQGISGIGLFQDGHL